MAADRDETGFFQTALLHQGPFSRLTLYMQPSRASEVLEKTRSKDRGWGL